MTDETDSRREQPWKGVGARTPLDCAQDAAGGVVCFQEEGQFLLTARGHGRAYEAGVYDRHVNAAPAQVNPHALEEGRDGGLARAVDAGLRHAAQRGEA